MHMPDHTYDVKGRAVRQALRMGQLDLVELMCSSPEYKSTADSSSLIEPESS